MKKPKVLPGDFKGPSGARSRGISYTQSGVLNFKYSKAPGGFGGSFGPTARFEDARDGS